MTIKTRYRADGNGVSKIEDTPRQAAVAFFKRNPTCRKCFITQGVHDPEAHIFTVTFGPARPLRWPDVTRKTIANLPDTGE